MALEDRRTRADKMRRLLEPKLAPAPAAKPAAPAPDVPAASPEERAGTGLLALMVLLLGLARLKRHGLSTVHSTRLSRLPTASADCVV